MSAATYCYVPEKKPVTKELNRREMVWILTLTCPCRFASKANAKEDPYAAVVVGISSSTIGAVEMLSSEHSCS